MIFNLYKNRGETPLECLERFRDTKSELEKLSMTYLGRLDPLAEGVLLVASEEDVKRKEEFLNLDKEYEFNVLFDFATDTYDVMGKITHPLTPSQREGEEAETTTISELDLIKLCKIYEGKREQKYPPYSSKNIAKNRDEKGDIVHDSLADEPETKNIEIYKLNFLKLSTLSAKELFGRLLMDILRVKGDFRQAEILELWKKYLIDSGFPSPDHSPGMALAKRGGEGYAQRGVGLAAFSAHVSSGTYIRSLVNDMGQTLGIPVTTLSIKRTCVGDYKIEDSLRF